MYPTLELWWQTFELTWIGIIVSMFLFISTSYFLAQKNWLDAKQILYILPTLIIISYFCGSYGWFVLRSWHMLPHSILELWQIIIPPHYRFHAGSLMFWVTSSFLLFLYQLPQKSGRKQWLDVLSLSLMLGVVVLGIFLTLGDHMIGISTNSQWGIHALDPHSELNKFTAVLPVGIFLSIAALVSYSIGQFIFRQQTLFWRWFGVFALFFFLLSIVLLFQNYPKHGVISINALQLDINQYILWLLSIGSVLGYIRNYRKYPRYLS